MKKNLKLFLLCGLFSPSLQASLKPKIQKKIYSKTLHDFAIQQSKNCDVDIEYVREIKSKDDYILAHAGSEDRLKDQIDQSLAHHKLVIDVRGDGNCGWRAFIVSTLMNAIKFNKKESITHLNNLIQTKLVDLFRHYDQNKNKDWFTNARLNRLKNYLCDNLEKISNFEDMNDVRTLFNEKIDFDYYMIMFLRYLNLEFVTKNLNLNINGIDIKTLIENLDDYFKDTKMWRTHIDNLNVLILSKATNISVYTTIEISNPNSEAMNKVEENDEKGKSFILSVPGHYRALSPYKYDQFDEMPIIIPTPPDENNTPAPQAPKNDEIKSPNPWFVWKNYVDYTKRQFYASASVVFTAAAIVAMIYSKR